MNNHNYDVSAAYTQEIEPILRELLDLCQAHGAPIVVMITYKQQENGPCRDPHCTKPDCKAATNDAAYMVAGKLGRMAMLQQAIVLLEDLPESIRDQFIGAIFAAVTAVKSGGKVEIMAVEKETINAARLN